jgi:hypothetical protein
MDVARLTHRSASVIKENNLDSVEGRGSAGRGSMIAPFHRRRRIPMRSKNRLLFLALSALLAGRAAQSQEPSAGCLNCQPGDDAPGAQEAGAAGAAGDADGVTVQYFQEALPKDGGQWNQSPFGPAWQPDVPAGWRPYTDGQWAHTDQGWAWVGNEPWAWATYHYGRWYQGENDRWAWVPGNVWAPAWVAWRQGGGYVGWAPLPPSVGYADGGVDLSQAEIPAGAYAFVPARSLLAPRLSVVVLPVEHGSLMLGRTADITRFASAGGRVVDLGVNVENIERATGRPVRQFRIAALQAGHAGGRPSGGQLAFAQPPALAHAARVSPGEFGRALERQSAARRARFAGTSRGASERSSRAQSTTERLTGSVGTRSRATSTDARTSDARSRSRREDGQAAGSSQPAIGGFRGRTDGSGPSIGGFGSSHASGSGSSTGGSGSGRTSGSGSSAGGFGSGRAGSGSSSDAKPSGGSSTASGGHAAAQQPRKPTSRSDKDKKPPAS